MSVAVLAKGLQSLLIFSIYSLFEFSKVFFVKPGIPISFGKKGQDKLCSVIYLKKKNSASLRMFKSISFLQKQRTLTGNKRKAVTKHRGAKRRQNLSSSSWAQPTPAPSRLGTLGFWFCGFGFFIVVVVVFCLVPMELLWGCHQRPPIALTSN